MRNHVFVSHSSADKAMADAVCAILESHGIRCWVAPRDILPGATWASSIFNAISDCRVMVLVLSGRANTSKHVMREVELAVKKDAVIVPFRTEDVEASPDLAYFLGTTHWLDALTPPMEARIHDLRLCVEAILSRDSEAQTDVPGVAAGQEAVAAETVSQPKPPATEISPELRNIMERADCGDAWAQSKLADHYAAGNGVLQDHDRAAELYRRAAEDGYTVAQYELAGCYAAGKGVLRDNAQAIQWYKRAAEDGYRPALYELGNCYAKGKGVARDIAEAVQWYRRGAEDGYSPAQYELGRCHAMGKGVSQDYAEAIEWYRRAAADDYGPAQYELGNCLAKGKGAAQDETEAQEWYRKAADAGYSPALDKLNQPPV